MRPPYFFPMDVFFTFFRMDTLYCVHRMLRGEKGSDPQHLRCLAAKNVQGGRERWATLHVMREILWLKKWL